MSCALLVVGTYDRFVLGIEFEPAQPKMQLRFSNAAHTGPVKGIALAPGSGFSVTCGDDGAIRALDVAHRRDYETVLHSDDVVNALAFARTPLGMLLVVGSAAGSVALFRRSDWSLLRRSRVGSSPATAAAVLAIAVHPSGKFFVSIDARCGVRLWNLTGENAPHLTIHFKMRFERAEGAASSVRYSLLDVRWNAAGSSYAVLYDRGIAIFAVDDEAAESRLRLMNHAAKHAPGPKITCFDWLSDSSIVVAFDDGTAVFICNVAQIEAFVRVRLHESRIKSCKAFSLNDGRRFLAVCCTDGHVKVFSERSFIEAAAPSVSAAANGDSVAISCVAEYFSDKTRFTCINVHV